MPRKKFKNTIRAFLIQCQETLFLSLSRDETHLKRVPSKQEGTFIPLKSVDYV